VNDLLTQSEVAAMLRRKVDTIRHWRTHGNGPPFIRIGKRGALYKRADVEGWLIANRVTPKVK
jgi:DNA-binding transcriptional MerR regulator